VDENIKCDINCKCNQGKESSNETSERGKQCDRKMLREAQKKRDSGETSSDRVQDESTRP